MGRKVNWEKYNPEFHLQEGEKVIREIRVAKLGINPHLFIILTCITLGIFLFFWQYFRYPRTAKIIILTNTRILSWETTIGSNPRLLRQESYQVSKLSYYQHELVQNKPPCLGLCKCLMNTKPWTTFRVFFSRFPSEMPPSYNKSPALTPAIGTGMRVAQNVYNAVSAGLLGNYISMATNAVKALVNMAKYALELVVRPEILLQGHYIEVDTSDEGSIELIQGFITDMLALYPRRNLLTKNKHEGAVNLEASNEAPLWDKKEDPVNINPQYLQLGPGEVILDALAEPPHITLMDWILAVCTFSLYYFFVIKDVKHYKGALLVTDRRLISIFVHNQHGGMKDGAKYIQMTNSWFFKGFGDSAIGVVKANNCITKCFQETSYNFLMEVGPGTLSIKPNPKNGKARIYAFFGHFYGYNHEQLVNSAQFPDRPGQNAIREGLLLPGEDVLAATGNKTKKDCNFMVTRLCTCGTNPADAKTMMVATTHRLAITMDASNYWEPEIIKYDYFTSLANVSGFQLHELEFSLPCSCLTCKKVEMAHVSIALRRDDYWTIPLLMPETKMSEQSIQAFARVISAAQNTFENMEKGVRSPNLSLARKFSDDDIDRAGANGAGGSGAPSGKSEKDPRVKSMGQEEVKDPRGSIHVQPADDNDNNV